MARRLSALCAALVLAAGPAAAVPLHADHASGKLEFTAVQAGARFTGAFRRFDVTLDFDPAQPAEGRLRVVVATASAETQEPQRDELLRGPDFLWTEKHPEAVFEARRFEPDGAGWRATGALTIRGVTRDAAVRFTLAPDGDGAVMKGTARLSRLAFGVGQGEYADTEAIGDAVEVRFELKLRPAGGQA